MSSLVETISPRIIELAKQARREEPDHYTRESELALSFMGLVLVLKDVTELEEEFLEICGDGAEIGVSDCYWMLRVVDEYKGEYEPLAKELAIELAKLAKDKGVENICFKIGDGYTGVDLHYEQVVSFGNLQDDVEVLGNWIEYTGIEEGETSQGAMGFAVGLPMGSEVDYDNLLSEMALIYEKLVQRYCSTYTVTSVDIGNKLEHVIIDK